MVKVIGQQAVVVLPDILAMAVLASVQPARLLKERLAQAVVVVLVTQVLMLLKVVVVLVFSDKVQTVQGAVAEAVVVQMGQYRMEEPTAVAAAVEARAAQLVKAVPAS